jgi:hypothetical protein
LESASWQALVQQPASTAKSARQADSRVLLHVLVEGMALAISLGRVNLVAAGGGDGGRRCASVYV